MIQNVPHHPSFLAYGFTFLFEAHGFITIAITGVTHHVELDDFSYRSSWSANLSSTLLSSALLPSPMPCCSLTSSQADLSFLIYLFFLPVTHADDSWAPVVMSQQTIPTDPAPVSLVLESKTVKKKKRKKIRQTISFGRTGQRLFFLCMLSFAVKKWGWKKTFKTLIVVITIH